MTETSQSILERPVIGIAEAAASLGMRADRVRAWLDGYSREGTNYPPVIRPSSTGDDVVTWGEFIELGYLGAYRSNNVPLQRLRPVIDKLRTEFATPYPLATATPYIYNRELVLKLQEESGIPSSIAVVVRSGQEVILADRADRFLKKVEFEPTPSTGSNLQPGSDGVIRRLYPAGRTSPVVMDPLVRFGRSTVDGITTERLWELFDAGEPIDAIAAGYDMTPERVNAAVVYEETLQSLAA